MPGRQAQGGGLNCEFVLRSPLWSRLWSDADGLYLEGECPCNSEQNMKLTDRRELYPEGSAGRGIRFLCAPAVVTDGKVRYRGDRATVSGAGYAEVYLCCATSFDADSRTPDGQDYRAVLFALRVGLPAERGEVFRALLGRVQA